MVDAKILETVIFFSDLVRKSGIHINNLILFGSSSTGTAAPGSDIDIAIISDDFLNRDIFDRALLTKDAEMHTIKKFRVPLDVITMTSEELGDPEISHCQNDPEGYCFAVCLLCVSRLCYLLRFWDVGAKVNGGAISAGR